MERIKYIFGCPAALYALMSHPEEEEGQKIYHYNNARYTHEQRSYSKQKLLSMSSGCLFNIFGQLTTIAGQLKSPLLFLLGSASGGVG